MLNSEQKKAVEKIDGPLLVLSGAGSGKTRVLTHRIAYIIENDFAPAYNVLAVTFTNKAAKEIKERLFDILGDPANDIWTGTFHSICMRILRRDIEKIGYGNNFVIYDSSDQLTVVKECYRELMYNDKEIPEKAMLHMIGRAKDSLITPNKYTAVYGEDFKTKKVQEVYTLYQKKLKSSNAMDFDDIIANTIRLFVENPEVLSFYQRKFRYILVDEYQDTNMCQSTLINMLAKEHSNICVVGDDDQSIYGFRGADITNILDFEKEFKNCCTIYLEQNYRSTQNILSASNSVIGKNNGRKQKKLWTDNGDGEKVCLYTAGDEHSESAFIAGEIKRRVESGEINYRDVAVLYRMNAQSRVIEEIFMRSQIPYKVVGGLKFYDRKEIKDIMAFLKLIQNSSDNVSFRRVINLPKRGIGNVTVNNIADEAENTGVSMYKMALDIEGNDRLKKSAGKIKPFTDIMEGFIREKENLSLSKLIEKVIEDTKIFDFYRLEESVQATTRIENVKEFQSVVLEFERNTGETSLESFLESISLSTDLDSMDEEENSVTFMTLHSAKGLEFPVVFMPGMEEGVFPGIKSMFDEVQVEEERRICYVGMTRAMKKLYLLNAKSRTLFGNTAFNKPSRFVDKELDMEFVENMSPANINSGFDAIGSMGTRPTSQFRPLVYSDTDFNFKVGDRVIHKKFGNGTVSKIDGKDEERMIEINFDAYGMKRLMAAYAKLVKE